MKSRVAIATVRATSKSVKPFLLFTSSESCESQVDVANLCLHIISLYTSKMFFSRGNFGKSEALTDEDEKEELGLIRRQKS